MFPDFHEYFMQLALDEAAHARANDEVPTGCIIIERPSNDATPPESCRILARAANSTECSGDPTAHAEILAIRRAAEAVGDFRLTGTILYVTKEPCAMCAGAIVLARIPLVVWGLSDPKRGGDSVFGLLSSQALIHRAETVRGILEKPCRDMLVGFFKEKRAAT